MKRLNKERGLRAEHYFQAELNRKGVQVDYIDGYYDFLVNNKIRVEVKSTRLYLRNGNKQPGIMGRFDFTDEDTRKTHRQKGVWYCFIIRHRGEFLLLGIQRATAFKEKRYISINGALKSDLLTLEEWFTEII